MFVHIKSTCFAGLASLENGIPLHYIALSLIFFCGGFWMVKATNLTVKHNQINKNRK